jgi:hypothetical protein
MIPKVGQTVVFIEKACERQIRWGSNDNPNLVLTVGSTYVVEVSDVRSSHTKLSFVGYTGKFNSVSFEVVGETVFKEYLKIKTQSMRPYIEGEDLKGILVAAEDLPEKGGMIARGKDIGACWYVSKTYFELNYQPED